MLELIEEHACHGGVQRFYRHESKTIGLPMRFSVYLPPQAQHGRVPALFYLAGLTCTEETFPMKAGAQRFAARHGLALIAPDTSPRGAGIAGETDAWDFGAGAGFYVDATREPWSKHYRMYSYVRDELRETVAAELPIDVARLGIFGHSMGGHGALMLALRNPGLYRSVSAFAPIAEGVFGVSRRRSRGMATIRCERTRRASRRSPLRIGHPHRSGPGRQIPRRSAESRRLRGRVPGSRSGADAAAP
jgi:S-formylglutathione hydrolase